MITVIFITQFHKGSNSLTKNNMKGKWGGGVEGERGSNIEKSNNVSLYAYTSSDNGADNVLILQASGML